MRAQLARRASSGAASTVSVMRAGGLRFRHATSPSGLRLGRLRGLPDGVLVRTVSAGSFEAVTRRLGVLHALQALGVPVWNDATAIERCVDKSMTTFLLGAGRAAGAAELGRRGHRRRAARSSSANAAAGPLVLKPLFGSQGRGLVLVRRPDDLPPPEAVGGVYYLQRFVGGAGPGLPRFPRVRRSTATRGRGDGAACARAGSPTSSRAARRSPSPLDRELAEPRGRRGARRSARPSAASTSCAARDGAPTCWR